MKHLASVLALVAVAALSSTAAAEEPQLALTLSADSPTVLVGEPLAIHVTVKNIGRHDLLVPVTWEDGFFSGAFKAGGDAGRWSFCDGTPIARQRAVLLRPGESYQRNRPFLAIPFSLPPVTYTLEGKLESPGVVVDRITHATTPCWKGSVSARPIQIAIRGFLKSSDIEAANILTADWRYPEETTLRSIWSSSDSDVRAEDCARETRFDAVIHRCPDSVYAPYCCYYLAAKALEGDDKWSASYDWLAGHLKTLLDSKPVFRMADEAEIVLARLYASKARRLEDSQADEKKTLVAQALSHLEHVARTAPPGETADEARRRIEVLKKYGVGRPPAEEEVAVSFGDLPQTLVVGQNLQVTVRVTNLSTDTILVPGEKVSVECTTSAGEEIDDDLVAGYPGGYNALQPGESYVEDRWKLPTEKLDPGTYTFQAHLLSYGGYAKLVGWSPIVEQRACWAGKVESKPVTLRIVAAAAPEDQAALGLAAEDPSTHPFVAYGEMELARACAPDLRHFNFTATDAAAGLDNALAHYAAVLKNYPAYRGRPETLLGLAQVYLAKDKLTPDEGFREKAMPLLKGLVTNYAVSDAAEEAAELLDELQTRIAAVRAPAPAAAAGAAVPDEGGAPPKPPSLTFKSGEYPRTDASTSAEPLSMLIACRLTGAPSRWAQVGRWRGNERLLMPLENGSWGDMDYLVEFGAAYDDTREGRFMAVQRQLNASLLNLVRWSGTGESYVNLLKGKCDLILVARGPSADELKLAADQKAAFDVQPVALDAFIFIASARNPAPGLTTDQIRDIYTGKIASWEDVHPKWAEMIAGDKPQAKVDPKIVAFQRERNSGSQETLVQLVTHDAPLVKQQDLIMYGMGGPYNALTQQPGGICYSFFFYEERMAPVLKDGDGKPLVKMLAVDGVMPSAETIAARRYPLVTEVYAVTLKGLDPKSPAARLRDWILSPEGQAVVAESGYVPLPAKPAAAPAPKP